MTPSKVIPFPNPETKIPSALDLKMDACSQTERHTDIRLDDDIVIQKDQTMEPLKNLEDIQMVYDYFIHEQKNPRNAALFVMGISVGLRVSDLICMRWGDLYYDDWTPRKDCQLIERKTARTKGQKKNTVNMNTFFKQYDNCSDEEQRKVFLQMRDECREVYQENQKVKVKPRKFRASPVLYSTLDLYRDDLTAKNEAPLIWDYIFSGGQEGHMGRQAAYKIIHKATERLGLGIKVGTHGLRKTFGYQMMEANGNSSKALLTLQQLFCHSSPETTLRYTGKTIEDVVKAYEDVGKAISDIITCPDIVHETA